MNFLLLVWAVAATFGCVVASIFWRVERCDLNSIVESQRSVYDKLKDANRSWSQAHCLATQNSIELSKARSTIEQNNSEIKDQRQQIMKLTVQLALCQDQLSEFLDAKNQGKQSTVEGIG